MLVVLDTENVAAVPNAGGQEGFATDWEHFIVGAEGGWYSGKTFIGARKLLTLHQYNAFTRDGDATFVPSLVVAPTYSNAMDFCVPHLEDALDECGVNYKWKDSGSLAGGRYSAPALILLDFGTRKNPSVMLVRSAEIPKRIAGFTVGAAWGDEPARWKSDRHNPVNDAFIQMLGRVRAERARVLQIILTYTNEGDATRVYEEMHSGHEDRRLYRIPTIENPVAEDFYERQLGNLTPELKEQYLDGKAAALRGGKVYSQFDQVLHVDPKIELNRDFPLHISLDFNIMPGMHLEMGQYNPTDDYFTVVHEIHKPRMSVVDMADALAALLNQIGWKFKPGSYSEAVLNVFGDATGGSKWAGSGESCYTILQQKLAELEIPYRIRVPRANPPVADRINAFNVALKDLRGMVHYKVHPRCRRLIEDLLKLQRDAYGEIDTTERKLSHASDAEGYRVWFLRPVRIDSSGVGGQISV